MSMSKREQARNERALQDLIRSIPGNDRCADCGARNPGWASYSIGAFLCLRCAALHRKMGTHISKVKSLSMDSWTSAQVDHMKQNGNNLVNRKYNPRGVKPAPVLDADDTDLIMEKFIRQKYQEVSLADGRPRPPERTPSDYARPAEYTRSPEASPPPPLPPKKGKLFHFSLRSTSSAYPLSKHEKEKKRMTTIEPTMENAFRERVRSPPPPLSSKQSRIFGANVGNDAHTEAKLATLRDMGFPDDARNSTMLKSLNGDLERTIESLVRLGEGSQPASRNRTPRGSNLNTPTSAAFPDSVKSPRQSDVHGSSLKPPSFNPFDRPAEQQHSQQAISHNPFGIPPDPQVLEQSLNNLQISQQPPQPLFPNSTGGYPNQTPPVQHNRIQQSMTPPVSSGHNPFFQSMHPTQSSSNPYASVMQPVQEQQPFQSHNPFFSQTFAASSVTQSSPQFAQFGQPTQGSSNPFQNQYTSQQGQTQPQQTQQPQAYTPHQSANPFGNGFGNLNTASATDFFSPNTQQPSQFPQPQQQQYQQQSQQNPMGQQSQQPQQAQQYSQPFQQPQQQQYQNHQQGQQQVQPVQASNPFFQTQNNPYQQQQQQQPQYSAPLMPQQTGRYDKTSILSLYNYPQLAPPLPTIIDEPSPSGENPPVGQPQSQPQTFTPASSSFQPQQQANSTSSPPSAFSPKQRSVTAPSRNPFATSNPNAFNPASNFANSNATNMASPPSAFKGIAAHSSRESTDLAGLQNGRHSPDAFAMLSARYGR